MILSFVIFLNIDVYDNRNLCIGVIGAVKILNNKGDILFAKNNLTVNVKQIVIPENGTFFSFTYGQNDEEGTLLQDGFCIYDLKKGLLVFDKKEDKVGFPFILEDFIVNGSVTLAELEKSNYYIFNTKKGILYVKEYSLEETPSMFKKITNDRIIYIDKTGAEKIDYFTTVKLKLIK